MRSPDHRRLLALAMIASLLTAGCALRRSESSLRVDLLERVPLGRDISEVRDLIREESWRVAYDDEARSFLDQRVRPPETVGAASIRAELGSYQGVPWRVFVTV